MIEEGGAWQSNFAFFPDIQGKGENSISRRLIELRGGSSVKNPRSVAAFDGDISDAGDRLVVVDFSATWCMPCKMIAPVFEEMSDEFNQALFIKVDVDDVPEIAQRYQVLAMPTFLFLRGGKIVGRFSGASAEKLREMLTSLL